jgi:transketolase
MRGTFAKTIAEIAARDERVIFLTADLGFMALDPIMEAAGNRFVNVGVAEQNMIGMATGLAEGGFIPFAYSIATFAALRPFEFIRNGPVLNHLPVRIVGVGAGFEYGTAGPTHHGIDDAGALRTLSGLTIVSPADFRQTRSALEQLWDAPYPIYLRLGKDDVNEVAGLDGRFRLGRVETVREGSGEVVIFAMGSIALEVAAACNELAERGVSATMAVVSSFNPTPSDDIAELARSHGRVVTVEAHAVDGALGSAVAEAIAEGGIASKLTRLGVRAPAAERSGSQAFFNRQAGIDRAAIVRDVLSAALNVTL